MTFMLLTDQTSNFLSVGKHGVSTQRSPRMALRSRLLSLSVRCACPYRRNSCARKTTRRWKRLRGRLQSSSISLGVGKWSSTSQCLWVRLLRFLRPMLPGVFSPRLLCALFAGAAYKAVALGGVQVPTVRHHLTPPGFSRVWRQGVPGDSAGWWCAL
nr:E4 protein [Lemur mastadenovirus]WGN96552.1 E4 protein [Lemur mastadenovirus]